MKINRPGDIRDWLLKQDTYTQYKHTRKRFPRDLYTVTNVLHLWELSLLDLTSLQKYNDKYRYLLVVTDVFSKYLHSVPLRSKTGLVLASAFETILKEPKY